MGILCLRHCLDETTQRSGFRLSLTFLWYDHHNVHFEIKSNNIDTVG
jgi:hypothetical protein